MNWGFYKNRLAWVGLLATLALSGLACQEEPTPGRICAPESTAACVCGTGEDGVQRCDAQGQSWSDCTCDTDEMEDDAGLPSDAVIRPDRGADAAIEMLDGENLYFANCGSCHGPDGSGGTGGPNIRLKIPGETDDELLEIIIEGKDNMPAISITEAEARAIIAYVRLWSSDDLDADSDEDADEDSGEDADESF